MWKKGHKSLKCHKKQRYHMNKSKHTRSYIIEAPVYLFMVISIDILDQLWYLDFGASNYMFLSRDFFNNYYLITTPKLVLLEDNSYHIIQGIGSVILQFKSR